jgi:hypothetical protein
MGADFMYAIVPHFKWSEKREELFKQDLQREPTEELLGFADDWALSVHVVELDETHPDDHTEESWKSHQAQLVRDYLVEALRDVAMSSGRRDVDTLRLAEMTYSCLITGGMSWGDSPTDIYDQFCHISELGSLRERCLQFAKEDYAAARGV